MNGTVTISIAAFDELREAHDKAETAMSALKRSAKELEVFLSFMITRENLDQYIDEFNRQSAGSKIRVVDGRVKIELNGYQDNN